MNEPRWNIEIYASEKTVWHYENAQRLVVNASQISFETAEGKTIITTLPYHVEEIK
jgi:hypothetical protein